MLQPYLVVVQYSRVARSSSLVRACSFPWRYLS